MLNAWPKLDFPILTSKTREASETDADPQIKSQQMEAGFEVTAPCCTKRCSGPDLWWVLQKLGGTSAHLTLLSQTPAAELVLVVSRSTLTSR